MERVAGALPCSLFLRGLRGSRRAPGSSQRPERSGRGARLTGHPTEPVQEPERRPGAQPALLFGANDGPEEVRRRARGLSAATSATLPEAEMECSGLARFFWDGGMAEPFCTQQSFMGLGIPAERLSELVKNLNLRLSVASCPATEVRFSSPLRGKGLAFLFFFFFFKVPT